MTQAEKNVITELARQLGELIGRFDEQEKSRNDTRVQDRDWRVEQSAKMSQIRQDVNDIKLSLATMPALMDDKAEAAVACGIANHEAADTHRTHSLTNASIAIVAVALFSVFSVIEFYDAETSAGFALAVMAALSILIFPVLNRVWK